MTDILFPVGRMIGGSVYKAQPELDNFGKPKLNGDGTPRTSFSFGIAIPKQGEQHWSQTPWGQQVFATGAAAHAQHHKLPTYAWKVKDGDSTVPNRIGKLMSSQEGCAGCWVIWFKQTWAPRLVTDKGQVPLIEPEAIMPGYYIEVFASVVGNTGPTPGLYMNPVAVNRVAFGEKINTVVVDTTSVGFGLSALPAGASLTPVGGGFNPAAQVVPHVPTYAPPAAMIPPPNPAFLAVPPAPVMAPPPPAVRTLTAKAGGATYEQMKGAGWSDDQLIQHGYMA